MPSLPSSNSHLRRRLRAFGLFLAMTASPLPAAPEKAPSHPFTVLSFNLRYDNPADGANAWPHRKALAAAVIADHHADLVGLQEALPNQLHDLRAALPGYDRIGVGRDDGKEKGEHSAILYCRDRFSVMSSGTFWLSETPETPGRIGWDAACPRIATWGVFEDRATRQRFLLVNTHLDHQGKRAKVEGIRLILDRIAMLRANDLPVILTGDFNSTARDPAIAAVVADQRTNLRLAKEHRSDAEVGGRTTFNGWHDKETGTEIDFIFVTPGIEVLAYRYLPAKRGEVFVSDHWPVLGKLRIPGKR